MKLFFYCEFTFYTSSLYEICLHCHWLDFFNHIEFRTMCRQTSLHALLVSCFLYTISHMTIFFKQVSLIMLLHYSGYRNWDLHSTVSNAFRRLVRSPWSDKKVSSSAIGRATELCPSLPETFMSLQGDLHSMGWSKLVSSGGAG